MAELTTDPCCVPAEQAACCAPGDKDPCCAAPAAGHACGCSAGADSHEAAGADLPGRREGDAS